MACRWFQSLYFLTSKRVFLLGKNARIFSVKRTFCDETSEKNSKKSGVESNSSVSDETASKVKSSKADPTGVSPDQQSSSQSAVSSKLLSLLTELSDLQNPKPTSNLNLAKPRPSIMYRRKTEENFEENSAIEKELGKEVVEAVKEVASSVKGDPEKTKSELTQKLLSLAAQKDTTIEPQNFESVAKIFDGMKVEKPPSMPETGTQVPMHRRMPSRPPLTAPEVNIFDSPPLNIFQPAEMSEKRTKLKLWDKLQEKELKLMTQFAPRNAIEEMIRWTEQGKHWKFPIDNDIGNPEENVSFHEHVFLERHLHGFPSKGPVRNFMELVCVGLSKNPFITVERKIANIDWFRQYFKDKEEILKEYNLLDK